MARDDRLRRRKGRRSRSNSSDDSNTRRSRSSRRSGTNNNGRKRSRHYDDESSSSTDEDNSNIDDDDDDIIWLEDDNSRRSRPLRKAIENACEEFNDREYSRRIFKFILQDRQLEGYRFYTGRNKKNIQEIRSTKELEAHIYEIYEKKRRERRKKEMKQRSSSSSRDITMKKKRSSREGKRRRSQRRRKSNSSKRSYSDSNSSSSSDSEEDDDIEMGTRTSQQRRKRRGGRRRSSPSRNINESQERSDGKTSIKKSSTSVSTGGGNIIYLTSGAFRLLVRKTVPKFDGGPYSRDIFKHIKRKTKETGLPIVIMKYCGAGNEKEVVNNKSELMDAINNIYEEERYMLSKAESTHIYFDYPNHPGTKTWKYAVRMVVAANLTSNFDEQTITKIHNRLPNAADNRISYFVGRPPTCVNATKNDIIERSHKQYEIEKRQLQRQLDDGYLQRYRVLGNAFWRALARKKCSTWIRTKCGQCKRAMTTVQCCMKVKQQTCCSKIRNFCRTDPKTGQDVYQKIAKSLEVTLFGHTSAWPLIIVLGCAAATIITIIIYNVLKKVVFNALSWERCAVFVDTTICGGSNLGVK